jgi:tetratricopeptide (TPR) repeat protein
LYFRFLDDENSANFIRSVSETYTISTLHRLALGGKRITRRAAVLALTCIGGRDSFEVVGTALRDLDRAVRVLAEDGIRSVWLRAGSSESRHLLRIVMRELSSGRAAEALELSNRLVRMSPNFAEGWNQRALAYFELGHLYEAIADCQRVLELTPHHFPAATGLGHCYMELDEVASAIHHFQYALSVCPDLEYVRAQINHLQRSL